jgi:cyclohexyl-isocyanide hydratase
VAENVENRERPGTRLGRVAFLVFDRMTTLDFLGVFDPLTRLRTMGFWPELAWDICALRPVVTDIAGLRLLPDRVGNPLDSYDLLVVPGGLGTRELEHDRTFIEWLQTSEPVPLKVSVCTGSVLLGAAGFLRGRAATTHPGAYE